MLIDQILINPPGMQSQFELLLDHFPKRFTVRYAPLPASTVLNRPTR